MGMVGADMRWVGFDIETQGDEDYFALQPWRVKEGTASITLTSAFYAGKRMVTQLPDDHPQLVQDLRDLGKPVALWNGVFDLAWLYAAGIDIRGILWVDGMHLWKFYANSQTMPRTWTLKDAAKKFLKHWPKQQEFLSMKSEELPDASDPYWLDRVSMDAEATALIAEAIWPLLTPKQQNLAKIQAISLPMMAMSWVNGIRIDLDGVKLARPKIILDMLAQEAKLGLVEPGSGPDNYNPSKVLRSPAKMRKLLYEDYGLTCTRFTDKGAKSTDKAALTYLSDEDDRIFDILKWKELNTILSKFIESPLKACEYLGSNVTHAAPKVFSAYTGRITYSAKVKKHHVGLSAHQLPRGKAIRQYILPRYDDDVIVEIDAKSQEGRLMALASGDEQMKKLFRALPPHDDAHSFLASKITGESFDSFLERKASKDPQAAVDRNAGKFTGLAYNYRSSPATARRIARVQYGIDVDVKTAAKWKKIFMAAYPAIPEYWKSAPKAARAQGYAETLAGARYTITKWDNDWAWSSSSSAINYRIQGSGADMKYLAMATLVTNMPELEDKLLLDLHDAVHLSIPKHWPVSYVQRMNRLLDNIDYKKLWGVDVDIPLAWEASVGNDEGTKFEIDYSTRGDQTLEQYIKSC